MSRDHDYAPAVRNDYYDPPEPKCDGNHGGPRCGDPECWNDDYIDPLAHLAGCDIDALALVGAFRYGGNRAAAKALAAITERRAGQWRGMPPTARFMELINDDERARLRGNFKEAL